MSKGQNYQKKIAQSGSPVEYLRANKGMDIRNLDFVQLDTDIRISTPK